MKRILTTSLISLLTVCGCTSDTIQALSAIQQLSNCSGEGLQQLAAYIEGMAILLQNTQDPAQLPVNWSYDQGTGAYTVLADVDDNGSMETTATGTVTATTGDVSDGFDPGEAVSVSWDVTGPIVTGQGSFNVTSSAQAGVTVVFWNITGTGMLEDSTCSFEIVSTDVTLNVTDPDDLMPDGDIDFQTRVLSSGDLMDGTITFDGTNLAQVSANVGLITVTFTINLDTWQVQNLVS